MLTKLRAWFNGTAPEIQAAKPLFHGGCHGCQQPLGECPGCQYFEADWSLPNLNSSAMIQRKNLDYWRDQARKERDRRSNVR
jgi:hypothetical protein